MMNMGKKIFCLALCAAMALLPSACGSGGGKALPNGSSSGPDASGGNVSMGRYIEKELPWPEGANVLADCLQLPDGSLMMIASGSELKNTGPWTAYTSTDGGASWAKKDTPWLEPLKDTTILSGKCDNAGNLYLLTVLYPPEFEELLKKAMETGEMPSPDKVPPNLVKKITPDGTVSELSPKWEKQEDGTVSLSDIAVLDNGDIIASHYNSKCIRYDAATGEKKNEYPLSSYVARSMLVYGNTLGAVVDGGKIQQFDLDSAGEQDPILLEGSSEGEGVVALSSDKKAILRCDTSGIYRYVIGGSIWERVVEGDSCSLGMPSVSIGQIFETGGNSFTVKAYNGDTHITLHYEFSADTPTVPSTEMAVYSLYDNPTVRQAIGVFQRDNPDIAVDMTVALDGQSAITLSDAIRSLNTELLAGKGPDVLLLDSLPISSYMGKGVLADLSGTVKPKIDGGELCKGIASTYLEGEALYAVPARFAVPQMWGLDDLVGKAKDLTSLADWIAADHAENPDIRQLMRMAPSELIYDFYTTCAPAWRNEDGSIKEAEFTQFLTDIKKIADTGNGEPLSEGQGNSIFMQAYPWASTGLPQDQQIRTILYLSQTADDFAIPDAFATLLGGRKFAFMPGQAENVYVPQTILGVNANSPLKDKAMELVGTALTEKVQTNDFEDGYAVNIKALNAGAAYPYLEGDDGMQTMINIDGQERIAFIFWPSDEFMATTMAAIQNLSTPSTQDPVLLEMVVSETQEYFTGEKPVETVVKAVIERTQAYLSE